MMRKHCDVLIAGAGPAGTATAIQLARAGLRVCLLDARAFPRDKVCGDFLSPPALAELDRLGFRDHAVLQQANAIRGATLFLDGEPLISRPFPSRTSGPALGRVVPRRLLDDWLLQEAERAGARLLLRTRLTGFAPGRDVVRIKVQNDRHSGELRTDLLVGADGGNSLVARGVNGGHRFSGSRLVALRAYGEGVRRPAHTATMYFSSAYFPGYAWLFPTGPGTANVGLGMVEGVIPRTADHLAARFRAAVASDPALRRHLGTTTFREPPAGWTLPTYDPRRAVTGQRTLLVGDAAGLVNPLNGEGIQQALQSARWAAESLLAEQSAGPNIAEGLRRYRARVARELGLDMAVCNFIVAGIRNRHFNELWLLALGVIVECARRDERFADQAGGILLGVVPARAAIGLSDDSLVRGVSALEAEVRAHLQDRARTPVQLAMQVAAAGMAGLRSLATRRSDLAFWAADLFRAGADLRREMARARNRSG